MVIPSRDDGEGPHSRCEHDANARKRADRLNILPGLVIRDRL